MNLPALAPYLLYLAFMAAYPVQVFTLGRLSGVFGVLLLAALLVMVLRVIRSRQKIYMPRSNFIILALLLPLPLSYLFALLNNHSEYFSATFIKTLTLYIVTFAISIDRNILSFTVNNSISGNRSQRYTSLVYLALIAAPLILMSVAVFRNSMGAIPPGIMLNEKYFYGAFLRAGAGFVDPNVLGVTVIIIIVIFLDKITPFRSLMILALGTMFITALLTFSRTAQILFAGFLFFKLRKQISRRNAFFLTTSAVAILIYFTATQPQFFSIFFERFSNAEGQSSSDDRMRQLSYFFDLLSSASFSDLLGGFGGQEVFQEQSGSAMHSAIFSIILDAGIIPGISILLFFGYAVFRSFRARSTGFRVLALLSSLVLPYIPEMFFLLVIYIIVEDHKAHLIQQHTMNGSHGF